jgi:hypothetical protein
MIAAFAIVVNQVADSPVESLQGLGLVLIGLPVYFVWKRLRARDQVRSRDEESTL